MNRGPGGGNRVDGDGVDGDGVDGDSVDVIEESGHRRRAVVVSRDPGERAALEARLAATPGIAVAAWAEDDEALGLLGVRVDVCVCGSRPAPDSLARLRRAGPEVWVLPATAPTSTPEVLADPEPPAAADSAGGAPTPLPGVARPALSARQRELLVAVVAGNDLLTAVARRLGVNEQTVKTHLRRIRAKYRAVGRSAPTRRDLYVRAVEDGLIPPAGRRLSAATAVSRHCASAARRRRARPAPARGRRRRRR